MLFKQKTVQIWAPPKTGEGAEVRVGRATCVCRVEKVRSEIGKTHCQLPHVPLGLIFCKYICVSLSPRDDSAASRCRLLGTFPLMAVVYLWLILVIITGQMKSVCWWARGIKGAWNFVVYISSAYHGSDDMAIHPRISRTHHPSLSHHEGIPSRGRATDRGLRKPRTQAEAGW